MASRLSTEEPKDDPAARPPLSRRDFLRVAGKEAAESGSRFLPGAGIAKAAATTPWWNRIARWRTDRTKEDTPDPDVDPSPAPTEKPESH